MSMTDRYLREADRLEREGNWLLALAEGDTSKEGRDQARRGRSSLRLAKQLREDVRIAQEDADNAPDPS